MVSWTCSSSRRCTAEALHVTDKDQHAAGGIFHLQCMHGKVAVSQLKQQLTHGIAFLASSTNLRKVAVQDTTIAAK